MKDNTSTLISAYSKNRSPELRNRLVENHLNLARMVAHKFCGRGIDFDDLFQVAAMALIKAVDRFDPERGVSLAGFAIPTIVGEVKNHFRDRRHMIRVPRRGMELINAIELKISQLVQEMGRMPTSDELAQALNISVDSVLEALEMRGALRPTSLDFTPPASHDPGEERSFFNLLGFEEEGYDRVATRDMLGRALKELPEFERQVIHERFINNLSQRDAARRLNVSQMTISRHERKAIERLKKIIH